MTIPAERRREQDTITEELKKTNERIDEMQESIRLNTELTEDILDLLKVLKWIANIVKWGVAVGAGVAAIWATMHGKTP